MVQRLPRVCVCVCVSVHMLSVYVSVHVCRVSEYGVCVHACVYMHLLVCLEVPKLKEGPTVVHDTGLCWSVMVFAALLV